MAARMQVGRWATRETSTCLLSLTPTRAYAYVASYVDLMGWNGKEAHNTCSGDMRTKKARC